ncbi:MAG: helix-turn-helix transcriptional regulator [Lachnospiraceae bacterium]|nr:helix-turn-helix transcriptional regulator [Lachnospiraceae bacterium]
MTREKYLKNLIKENGLTIKEFAQNIEMPYSTLLTMLNEEKIGNAAVDSVIKICKGLNITIQELQAAQESESVQPQPLVLSRHEEQLIVCYRQKVDLQKAVNILLLSDNEA